MTPFRLRQLAGLLHAGGVLAYPTEAVFGLGCDPLNADAVHRLLRIKQRPVSKGVILIGASKAQLLPFCAPLSNERLAKLDQTWPGPVTWLVPAAPHCPTWLTGGSDRIAVRQTAHRPVIELCNAFGGALVSTSANRAGQPPARSALQARMRCPGIDGVVHGALGGLRKPTEIRDLVSETVVRKG